MSQGLTVIKTNGLGSINGIGCNLRMNNQVYRIGYRDTFASRTTCNKIPWYRILTPFIFFSATSYISFYLHNLLRYFYLGILKNCFPAAKKPFAGSSQFSTGNEQTVSYSEHSVIRI